MIVENATPGLRGLLSRWMIQPKAGVFVGRLSGRVRDELWEIVRDSGRAEGGLMICGARTEQGFRVECFGDTTREPVDYEGLTLIRFPTDSREAREHFRKRGRNVSDE